MKMDVICEFDTEESLAQPRYLVLICMDDILCLCIESRSSCE